MTRAVRLRHTFSQITNHGPEGITPAGLLHWVLVMAEMANLHVNLTCNSELVRASLEECQILLAHGAGARVIAKRLGVEADYDRLIASLLQPAEQPAA